MTTTSLSPPAPRAAGSLIARWRWEAFGLFCLALITYYIGLQHRGTYPQVFADEEIYSRLARLVPLRDATIPSYLYLALYGATNACGAGFFPCAQKLNLLFFAGAAPFLYLTARQVCSKPVALVVALLCVLAPAKAYSAYFMPESMYFFGFALLGWVALSQRARGALAYAALTGATLGLMTLIKVHALFLLPSLAAFVAFTCWQNAAGAPWLRRACVAAMLTVVTALAVKFGLGYLFGGAAALTWLGSLYGKVAPGGAHAGAGALAKLLAWAWIGLRGHLLMLALLFPLPLAAIAWTALRARATARANPRLLALTVFTVLMLGAALALTIAFTASIADLGPREGERLHARYYNFCFPLLLMLGAAHASWRGKARWTAPPVTAAVIALVLGAAALFAAFTLNTSYRVISIDAPELAGLGLGTPGVLASLLIGLQLCVLAVWVFQRQLAALLFVAVALPLATWHAEHASAPELAASKIATPYDKAGIALRRAFDADARNSTAIAGNEAANLMRAKFQLDAAAPPLLVLPPGAPLAVADLPGRLRYLLVLDGHAAPAGFTPVIDDPVFQVYSMGANRPLGANDMSVALPAGPLAGAQGLSSIEPWGRWSDAKLVRLDFAAALPVKLNLFLTLRAFGPNTERDIIVRVGAAETRFRLHADQHEVYLPMVTDGASRSVTIEVPEPVTPKSLGYNSDDRTLGLGFDRVEIGERQ